MAKNTIKETYNYSERDPEYLRNLNEEDEEE